MINVGIDVSKKKHDICVIDSNGTILKDHFTVENNKKGFDALCQTIESFEGGDFKNNVRIALEDTGHYAINLLHFLRSKGYSVYTYNPSDSTSRWTPLPLANSSYCQACSGL